jgi:hypothetical protein
MRDLMIFPRISLSTRLQFKPIETDLHDSGRWTVASEPLHFRRYALLDGAPVIHHRITAAPMAPMCHRCTYTETAKGRQRGHSSKEKFLIKPSVQ